jgi:hypothetical protein
MEPKRYRLYVITSPAGGQYVGLTCNPVEMRWGSHLSAAAGTPRDGTGPGSIADEIRRLGPDGFHIEHVASALDARSAALTERDLIIQYGTMFPRGLNRRMARTTQTEVTRDWIWLRKPQARAA